MCGGIAAALIYDFLLYPQSRNFSTRRNILLHGPEHENYAAEPIREDNSSPGPSQWPKHWTTCDISALLWFADMCVFKLLSSGVYLTFLYYNKNSFFHPASFFHLKIFSVKFNLSSFPCLHYTFTRITQCIFRSTWPWHCFSLYHIPYRFILFKAFGKCPRISICIKTMQGYGSDTPHMRFIFFITHDWTKCGQNMDFLFDCITRMSSLHLHTRALSHPILWLMIPTPWANHWITIKWL